MTDHVPMSRDDAIVVLCAFSLAMSEAVGPGKAFDLIARV